MERTPPTWSAVGRPHVVDDVETFGGPLGVRVVARLAVPEPIPARPERNIRECVRTLFDDDTVESDDETRAWWRG
jgi:hypothetical protein